MELPSASSSEPQIVPSAGPPRKPKSNSWTAFDESRLRKYWPTRDTREWGNDMSANAGHRHVDSQVIDSVIVGGGIAGLSAALFLARAGRSTIVYDAGRSRILSVDRIREFVGFDGLSPEQMLTRAREEVLRYRGRLRQALVERIDQRNDGLFDVKTAEEVTRTRTVVLATGLIDELPHLEGLGRGWGRDLHICPGFGCSET